MEKDELLNILYSERQRVSEKNKDFGWSIWALIGTIATLLWILIDLFNNKLTKNPQEIFLFSRSFCTMLLSLLLFKDFYKKKNYEYYPYRFVKSSGQVLGIVDIIIPTLLFVSYIWPNLLLRPLLEILDIKSTSLHESSLIFNFIISFAFSGYITLKGMEMYCRHKFKQEAGYVKNWPYLLYASLMLLCGILDFSRTEGYMLSIRFSLVISGIMAIVYILIAIIGNPLRKLISSIDRLIDKVLINEEIDVNFVYEEFISIKIGYKYSRLYQGDIQKIYTLIEEQNNYIRDIDSIKYEGCPIEHFNEIKEVLAKADLLYSNHQEIINMATKMTNKMSWDVKRISLDEEELKKLISAIKKALEISKENETKIERKVEEVKEMREAIKICNAYMKNNIKK